MVEVKICVGSSCYLKGAQKIIDHLTKVFIEDQSSPEIELSGEFCLGNCGDGVAISVKDDIKFVKTPEEAENMLREYLSE